MKTPSLITACLVTLILLTLQAGAQQAVTQLVDDGSSKPGVENNPPAPLNAPSARIDSLRTRRATLSKYLETVDPASRDYDATVSAIKELDVQLHALLAGSTTTSTTSAPAVQAPPRFELATPGDTVTNESLQPTLSWTEDLNPAPHPTIEKYVVEISDE